MRMRISTSAAAAGIQGVGGGERKTRDALVVNFARAIASTPPRARRGDLFGNQTDPAPSRPPLPLAAPHPPPDLPVNSHNRHPVA
jgi:hypothetical protein